jgi:hypothetical protein
MPRTLSRSLASCALAAAALSAGCGTARIVQRTPRGGVIELEGDHNKAMEHANEQMAAQCNNNFLVVRDGDEPVSSAPAEPGAPIATVFRVHYECGDGTPSGASPPPPAPPAAPR